MAKIDTNGDAIAQTLVNSLNELDAKTARVTELEEQLQTLRDDRNRKQDIAGAYKLDGERIARERDIAQQQLAEVKKLINMLAHGKVRIKWLDGDNPFYSVTWDGHCHCSHTIDDAITVAIEAANNTETK